VKYDFTTVPDRTAGDCIAEELVPWDVKPDPGVRPIPMWVADMTFRTAPPVLAAIETRLARHHMGYFSLSDEYYDSILSWQARRLGVTGLAREDIGYENGVLGGVSSAVQALTCPGDRVLVHAPCYVGFTHTMERIGRVLVHSPLRFGEDGVWRMDYEDMDRAIRENGVKVAIFCSPHNPAGRVWERREIEEAMAVYAANGCFVISDEIWSDVVMPGQRHIPTQSVSEDARRRTVALYSPSKGFSLAGLVGSYHVIYDGYLKNRVVSQGRMSGYNACSVLSMHALIGAFSAEGEVWLTEMLQVVDANLAKACAFFGRYPGVRVMRPQGTYMLFLDCGGYCRAHGVPIAALQRRGVRCGVIWQNGEDFVWPDSIRMNLALPAALLDEALARLERHVFTD
jgi:cystathionine beta-lyase